MDSFTYRTLEYLIDIYAILKAPFDDASVGAALMVNILQPARKESNPEFTRIAEGALRTLQTPYQPPAEKHLKNTRNILNHQELLVKTSEDPKAWLLALAQRLAVLEATTDPEALANISREIEEVYARLPERLLCSELTEWILETTRQLSDRPASAPGNQDAYNEHVREIESKFGVSLNKMKEFANRKRRRLRRMKNSNVLAVDARVKTIYSVLAKQRLKPKYEDIGSIRDMIAFRITVADDTSKDDIYQLALKVFAVLGGQESVDTKHEIYPSFTALHMSPQVTVEGTKMFCEVRIIRQKDAFEAEQNPFDGHVVYKYKMAFPDQYHYIPRVSDLKPGSFDDNFRSLYRSIAPYRYLQLARRVSGRGLETRRILHREGHGCVGDVLAIAGYLDPDHWPLVSKQSPATGWLFGRLTAGMNLTDAGWKTLVEDGDVLVLRDATADRRSPNSLPHDVQTVSEPLTWTLLKKAAAGSAAPIRSNKRHSQPNPMTGADQLLKRWIDDTGLRADRISFGSDRVRAVVAEAIAKLPGHLRFPTPETLLLFLELDSKFNSEAVGALPDGTRRDLLKRLDELIMEMGREKVIRVTGHSALDRAFQDTVPALANGLGIDRNKDVSLDQAIVLGLGLGLISEQELRESWQKRRSNGASRLTGDEVRESEFRLNFLGGLAGLLFGLGSALPGADVIGFGLHAAAGLVAGAVVGRYALHPLSVAIHEYAGHLWAARAMGYALARVQRHADGGWVIVDGYSGREIMDPEVRRAGPHVSVRTGLGFLLLAGVLAAGGFAADLQPLSTGFAYLLLLLGIDGLVLGFTDQERPLSDPYAETSPAQEATELVPGKMADKQPFFRVRTRKDPTLVAAALLKDKVYGSHITNLRIRNAGDRGSQIEFFVQVGDMADNDFVKTAVERTVLQVPVNGTAVRQRHQRLLRFESGHPQADLPSVLRLLASKRIRIASLSQDRMNDGLAAFRLLLLGPEREGEKLNGHTNALAADFAELVSLSNVQLADSVRLDAVQLDSGDPWPTIEFFGSHDVPGVLHAVLESLDKDGWTITGHFRARNAGIGCQTKLQLQAKAGTEPVPVDQSLENIRQLYFPLEPTPPNAQTAKQRRVWLNLRLRKHPDALLKATEALTSLNVNILSGESPSFGDEREGPLEMELLLPDRVTLQAIEKKLQGVRLSDGQPIIDSAPEMAVLRMSREARDFMRAELKRRLALAEGRPDEPAPISLPPDINLHDSYTLDNFQRALDLADKAHDGQIREATGNPYSVHLYEMALNALDDGVTNPLVIQVILLHDALEDFEKNRWKALSPELRAGMDEQSFKSEKRIEIRHDILNSIRGYPHKLLRDLEFLTARKDYGAYAEDLSARDLDYLLAIKLWDQANNYESIFSVGIKEQPGSQAFARKVLSRGIRYLLPIAQHRFNSNDPDREAYEKARRRYLGGLVSSVNRLSTPLAATFAREAAAAPTAETTKSSRVWQHNITRFVTYMSTPEGRTSFPDDVTASEREAFRMQLLTIRNTLEWPERETFVAPWIGTGFFESAMTRLRAMKNGRHSFMATVLGMPVVESVSAHGLLEERITVLADRRWKAALFVLADPLSDLAAVAALFGLASWSWLLAPADPIAILTVLLLGAACAPFINSLVVGSAADWRTAWKLMTLPSRAFPRLVTGYAGEWYSQEANVAEMFAAKDELQEMAIQADDLLAEELLTDSNYSLYRKLGFNPDGARYGTVGHYRSPLMPAAVAVAQSGTLLDPNLRGVILSNAQSVFKRTVAGYKASLEAFAIIAQPNSFDTKRWESWKSETALASQRDPIELLVLPMLAATSDEWAYMRITNNLRLIPTQDRLNAYVFLAGWLYRHLAIINAETNPNRMRGNSLDFSLAFWLLHRLLRDFWDDTNDSHRGLIAAGIGFLLAGAGNVVLKPDLPAALRRTKREKVGIETGPYLPGDLGPQTLAEMRQMLPDAAKELIPTMRHWLTRTPHYHPLQLAAIFSAPNEARRVVASLTGRTPNSWHQLNGTSFNESIDSSQLNALNLSFESWFSAAVTNTSLERALEHLQLLTANRSSQQIRQAA